MSAQFGIGTACSARTLVQLGLGALELSSAIAQFGFEFFHATAGFQSGLLFGGEPGLKIDLGVAQFGQFILD